MPLTQAAVPRTLVAPEYDSILTLESVLDVGTLDRARFCVLWLPDMLLRLPSKTVC